MRNFVLLIALFFSMLVGCERKASPGASTQVSPSAASVVEPAHVSSSAAAVSSPPGLDARDRGKYREVTWRFENTKVGEMQAVVLVPEHAGPGRELPVLITMHGQGEAMKGPAKGARGWVDDYWLPKALQRLNDPPLKPSDFRNQVNPSRLELINRGLATKPYRGMIIVCPYTPHRVLRGQEAFIQVQDLADFLVDELLPKVRKETPAQGTTAATAVDGVSLGGRAALLVGLTRPEAFGVIGALQPAFAPDDAPRLAKLARQAIEKNPDLKLRMLTSEGDFYLGSTKVIAEAMTKAGVNNTFDVVAGDHSYDFNRGPGVYEMLFFHDRALRGEETGLGADAARTIR